MVICGDWGKGQIIAVIGNSMALNLILPFAKESFFFPCFGSSNYLTIFIRRVTSNTELDTVYLFVRHGQRTHFGVYPFVCPFSTWPGQGFYVELFLIGALNRLQRWQRSRAFLAQTSTYKGNVLCFFAEK